jgi:ubiquinone/menaquinone biosynthesis C-methylase UbiE
MLLMGVIVLSVVILSVIAIFAFRPMRIPHDPTREGVEDSAALQAYYRVSRWPIFTFERHLVLKALSKIKPQGQLVDIGCGPGYLAAKIYQKFPDVKIVGLDINELTLKNAKRTWLPDLYPGLEFLIGDAQQLPFPDCSLDLIVSSLSLHHWPDAQAAFQEIFRTLKPDGIVLIFDLRRDSPSCFYWALKIGQAFLAPKSIRNINGAVGSFWAAYTPSEIEAIVHRIPMDNLQIESGFGWMLISGNKPDQFKS